MTTETNCYLTAGELAELYNYTTSKMNKILEERGYQYKRKEPQWNRWKWALTEKGKQFGKMHATCKFPNIIWNTKILKEF